MVKRCSPKVRRIREDALSDLASSVWRTIYVTAMLETDAAKMEIRISEARTAMNGGSTVSLKSFHLSTKPKKLLCRGLRL
jgi:hypothetical protein